MAASGSTGEVWILGATGRVGRAVAARLAGTGISPVLVGRDPVRLDTLAASIGEGVRTIAAGSVEQIAAEVRQQRPSVVVNTIGPFTRTAIPIARACLPGGGNYLDLANDMAAVPALLALHSQAVAAGSTLVTGVGFGVVGTESVVAKLCQGRPTPSSVRVDALASVATEAGTLGEALAATIIEALPAGGRRYRDGRLVKARLGGDFQRLTLPDGQTATSVGMPTGELHAAWIASAAPSVTVTSGAAATTPLVRAILPLVSALTSIRAVRRFATRRLASLSLTPRPRPREYSWGHAVVRWPDGTSQEGWLRAGEGMSFTEVVVAEVATRLARGAAPAGAYTPAAAFGPELAVDAGGEFILDPVKAAVA